MYVYFLLRVAVQSCTTHPFPHIRLRLRCYTSELLTRSHDELFLRASMARDSMFTSFHYHPQSIHLVSSDCVMANGSLFFRDPMKHSGAHSKSRPLIALSTSTGVLRQRSWNPTASDPQPTSSRGSRVPNATQRGHQRHAIGDMRRVSSSTTTTRMRQSRDRYGTRSTTTTRNKIVETTHLAAIPQALLARISMGLLRQHKHLRARVRKRRCSYSPDHRRSGKVPNSW